MEYRPERLNVVADALSRRGDEAATPAMPNAVLDALSGPSFELYDTLRRELQDDPTLRAFRDSVVAERGAPWRVEDGLVLRGAQVFVPTSSSLAPTVIELAHSVGHEGIQKTLRRLRQHFVLDHDRRAVEEFVRVCPTCQRNKTDSLHPAGLLQPLEVPSSVWSDIAMDFVEGLPRVNGKSVILTVVDRFSKHAHFIALSHPYTATSVAKAFFEAIVRLHGFPRSIVTVTQSSPVMSGRTCSSWPA